MGEKNWGKILVIILMAILSSQLVLANNQTTNQTEELENPTIVLQISDSTIEAGEEIQLSIGLNSPEKQMTRFLIDWDSGSNYDYEFTSEEGSFYMTTEEKEYDDDGDYTITVKVYCGDELCAEKSKNIEVEEPEIIDEKPTVTLISPSDDLTSKQDQMTFKFKAVDDFAIQECKFELYIKQNGLKVLEYEQDISDPKNNKEMELKLEQFEDANYTWYIICYDNNSQKDTDSRDFIIKTVNHPREKEIFKLLEDLDNFMESEEDLSPEEKDTLKELGISENLKYYKKRLLQINQDLGNNIKFIADETLREKRKIETHQELDEIKSKIPYSIQIIDNDEYIKNSLTTPLDEIISKYIESKNIILDSRKLKKLVKSNTEIQEKISVSTEVKVIEIEYNDSSEIITTVKKEISINDPEIKRVLEYIPSEIKDDIEFKIPAGETSNNIYEILIEDLEDDTITYFIKGEISTNKIKASETILFEENAKSTNGITGLAIFDGEFNQTSIIIGCVVLSLLITIALNFKLPKKKKLNKWKNHPKTKEVTKWLEEGNEEIKKENTPLAKEKYHKIKQEFSLLPERFKQHAYPHIEELRIDIDKREMRDLIREYEKAKREGNSKEAGLLYEKIKSKYKNLPKKYQIKVYEKIIK